MLLKQPRVPLARSGARKTDQGWPFLALWSTGGAGLELGPGALTLPDNILRESSWPWPRSLGSNNLHERRDVRTQEVWGRHLGVRASLHCGWSSTWPEDQGGHRLRLPPERMTQWGQRNGGPLMAWSASASCRESETRLTFVQFRQRNHFSVNYVGE